MVEKIIALLKELFPNRIQMFSSPCIFPDSFVILFSDKNVIVRWCEEWKYIEVLGLSDEDYKKVFDACGCYFSDEALNYIRDKIHSKSIETNKNIMLKEE